MLQLTYRALPALEPLSYHWRMREYLNKEEPELWKWFSSNKAQAEYADAARMDLLKSTYRLEREAHGKIYDLAREVAVRLELDAPISMYQAQGGEGFNAALAWFPDEIHFVFVGAILKQLSAQELRALLGHEMAHYALYSRWDGGFRVTADILNALCCDSHAESSHYQSARLFGLYTEIFADRGAFCAAGEAATPINTLLKTTTGLQEVSAASYLRQAEEIFQTSEDVKALDLTHPESFIRARALDLWEKQDENIEAEIERMIEGSATLHELDLLGQERTSDQTRRLIVRILRPAWMRTERALAHAGLYFDDFRVEEIAAEENNGQITIERGLRDYYCYVILDFVAVTRELEDVPLAGAVLLANELGVANRFAEIARKELGLTKRVYEKVAKSAQEIVGKLSGA